METALIGLIGILLGIFVSEFIRRKNRIETYSNAVFEKRLNAYEGLFQLINESQSIGNEVINNLDYSEDERKDIWTQVILKVGNYCDNNALYLNEDIIVHSMASLMGIEEIAEINDINKKDNAIKMFEKSTRDAKIMIKKETGLSEIEKVYKKISKANPKSDIINYFEKLKEEKISKNS